MNSDIKNTPWECDNIVLLSGDWKIERAADEGQYKYSVSGIESRNLATAADLVKWKMAKFLPLDLLLPWEGDGITFAAGTEILRDFIKSSKKEKYYLIRNGGSAKGLLRVNNYYLVKEKLADPSDELKRTISNKKVKSKKYNRSCEPWPEDDIFILDTVENESIERGFSSGLYRVRVGGMTTNWRADVLISRGKAITGYDVRLSELASSENASLQEYYKATKGFWLSEVGETPSFSEIARIWCSLQYKPEGSKAGALLADLNKAIASYKNLSERFADFNDKANEVDGAIKELQPKVMDLEYAYNECKVFQYRTVADDFSDFPQAVENFASVKNEIDAAYKDVSKALTEIYGLLTAIKKDVNKIEDVKPFPKDVLPDEFVSVLQAKENEYSSIYDEMHDFSPYEARLSDLNDNAGLIKSAIEEADVSGIKYEVERTTARKAELDSLKEVLSIDERFKKKPGLFSKPNKEDGIKYTTGVQIKNRLPGRYVVSYAYGSIEVSVQELIYLKLAVKI